MSEPRSDEDIRRLIGEDGPSWRRRTDIRIFYLFIYAACLAAIVAALSTGILLNFSVWGLVIIAVFSVLSYGVFKKNQICAMALFICGTLLTAFRLNGKIPGIIGDFPIGFLAAFLLGIIGAFGFSKSKGST